MRIAVNPLASTAAYSEREALVVSIASARAALAEVRRWPGYQQTPLRALDPWARDLGLGQILYKDESTRLEQGSFKILGGAYAATVKLRETGASPDTTLCCATDGNHGRSVAFAARRFGCKCVVFMHERAPTAKAAAITALGARVVLVQGTYDDSIRHAHAVAEKEGWLLVPDTSEDELDPTTRLVMQGYGVMVLEIMEQLGNNAPPTHVMLQGGVGGLAAAVSGLFAELFGAHRPKVIVVEPESAACLLESALRLKPSKVDGDLVTAMEMLSAGEASPVAWPILQRRADVFLAIDDAAATGVARNLSAGGGVTPTINAGVSGAAGLAGLSEVMKIPALAAALRLDAGSRVLVFGTEERTVEPAR